MKLLRALAAPVLAVSLAAAPNIACEPPAAPRIVVSWFPDPTDLLKAALSAFTNAWGQTVEAFLPKIRYKVTVGSRSTEEAHSCAAIAYLGWHYPPTQGRWGTTWVPKVSPGGDLWLIPADFWWRVSRERLMEYNVRCLRRAKETNRAILVIKDIRQKDGSGVNGINDSHTQPYAPIRIISPVGTNPSVTSLYGKMMGRAVGAQAIEALRSNPAGWFVQAMVDQSVIV